MMQDRTNPNSYGPRQTDPNQDLAQALQPQMRMDVGPQIYEALETADPETTWLANSIGSTVKRRGMSDLVMKSAFMGETPDELRAYADAEKATNEALRMAKQSANMSDQEFQSLLGQLEQETNSQVRPAERPGLEMPNSNQLGLAGLTALFGSKRFAFDALATPFNQKLGEQEQGYQDDILREKREWGQRSERLQLLGDKLGFAREDSRFYRNEALRQADKLSEIGIEKGKTLAEAARRAFNQGQIRLGEARKLEADAWTAETVQEAELAVNQLISDYQDVKGIQMDPDTVKKIFAGAKLRESQAIYAAQFAETTKREDALVKEFNDKLANNFPSQSDISDDNALELNNEAGELAASLYPPDSKEYQAMLMRMRVHPRNTVASERLAMDQQLFPLKTQQMQGDIAGQALLNQGRALDNAKKAADPTGTKAEKRKRIQALTKQATDAQRDMRVLWNTIPKQGSEGYEKALDAWKKSFEKAYLLMSEKRQAGGGKAPTRDEFFKEQFGSPAKPSNKQPTVKPKAVNPDALINKYGG